MCMNHRWHFLYVHGDEECEEKERQEVAVAVAVEAGKDCVVCLCPKYKLLFGGTLDRVHRFHDRVPSSSIHVVNPAWRKSIWHVIASAVWSDGASAEEMQAKFNAITETTDMFRAVAPDTGAYVNKADVNEPNWQASFFGSNYKRLLQMKMIIDPEHQLACHHCVGSEVWNDDFTYRTG
ncbi:hypothetical protein SELMODRAFT_424934 [Selaginella moellendorffii]|uniref:Berberine/berberine-like domain-containing protein n=1 Tax=Selaginella moellendorffii TaxID=88036 RepID=D8SRG8_SELML|nr:hypothetical protein SELMODRAFT_424934 [Selaginella moellendorffii]